MAPRQNRTAHPAAAGGVAAGLAVAAGGRNDVIPCTTRRATKTVTQFRSVWLSSAADQSMPSRFGRPGPFRNPQF
jgi:hypothetical protein